MLLKASFLENNMIKQQNQDLLNRKVGSKDIWNFWRESWFHPF